MASQLCPDPLASALKPMDCSFYSDCLEAVYQCGVDGYPLGYGLKYCEAFRDNYAIFDEQGQSWVNDTLLCLK